MWYSFPSCDTATYWLYDLGKFIQLTYALVFLICKVEIILNSQVRVIERIVWSHLHKALSSDSLLVRIWHVLTILIRSQNRTLGDDAHTYHGEVRPFFQDGYTRELLRGRTAAGSSEKRGEGGGWERVFQGPTASKWQYHEVGWWERVIEPTHTGSWVTSRIKWVAEKFCLVRELQPWL